MALRRSKGSLQENRRRSRKFLETLFASIALASALTLEVHAEEGQNIPEAFAVACRDFIKEMKKTHKESSETTGNPESIKNYEITTYQDGENIVIVFYPRPLHGMTLRGGGGKYIIDASTLKILRSDFYR